MEHLLPAFGLYVLSGLPGAGKSAFAAKLREQDPRSVLSADETRERLLGRQLRVAPDGFEGAWLHGWDSQNGATLEIMRAAAKARLSEQLPVVIDMMSLTEADRGEWARLAQEHGAPFKVLILEASEETALARNALRALRLPDASVRQAAKSFVRHSAWPSASVADGDVARFVPNEAAWNGGAWDVVGDAHGLLGDLRALLEALGYDCASGVPTHPAGRRLIFLGDLVDRGPESIETLDFVRRAVREGGHLCLLGNHEQKLVNFWRRWKGPRQEIRATSPSSAQTAAKLLRLDEAKAKELAEFCASLPKDLVMEAPFGKVAFTHADQTDFDPIGLPKSAAIYGASKLGAPVDSDACYQRAFESGRVGHWLIRGHIKETSLQPRVFSLDRDQAFGGEMLALPLDAFAAKLAAGRPEREAFESSLAKRRCAFDFDVARPADFALQDGLERLVSQKLATRKAGPDGLSIWKYSKKVFFDKLWSQDPLLLKARGLVTDFAGNIVQHPFDKVFNYQEEGAGMAIADEAMVQWVEKLNGFFAAITGHPFRRGQLLPSTTGSFDSKFVGYIDSLLDERSRGRLASFLAANDVTLMFEAIHPEDPHIIEYGPQDHGLWLIGARGKALADQPWAESELDALGAELGLRRPKVEVISFGQAKERARVEQTEGGLVRSLETGLPELKFKTSHYLTNKFLGRMGAGQVKALYANPRAFKEKLDEEFAPMADAVVQAVERDAFLAMDQLSRVALVRELIAQMRQAGTSMGGPALPGSAPSAKAGGRP